MGLTAWDNGDFSTWSGIDQASWVENMGPDAPTSTIAGYGFVGGGAPDKRVAYQSCTIPCAQSNIEVTLKYPTRFLSSTAQCHCLPIPGTGPPTAQSTSWPASWRRGRRSLSPVKFSSPSEKVCPRAA